MPGSDVVARARAYAAGGASIISVLVEPHWFGGSLADLTAVRASVTVPVLAKEFVVDRRQLPMLRAAGADLVLLIAALHPVAALRALVRAARDIGLEPLVEAHDRRELDRALATEARLIGLNNRDLRTLAVDPEHAVRLRADVPDDRLVIAESGVRDPATVAGWRAVGFDAALIGEALMATGDDPDAIRARTAAFVAAGRPPSPTQDPAAADRAPLVKICGVTDVAGALAAVRAGADAIGLNFVPGTPRALDERSAAAIIGAIRSAASPAPMIVGVVVDRDPDDANALARRLDLDALQLHGAEPPEAIGRYERPAWKVLHLPPECADDAVGAVTEAAAATVERARTYLAAGAARIMLDTSGGPFPGGTGRRAATELAAAIAREVPIVLAGGLDRPTSRARCSRSRRSAWMSRAASSDDVAMGRSPSIVVMAGRARTPSRSVSSSSGPRPPGSTVRSRPPARPPCIGASSTSTPGVDGGSRASSAVDTCPRRWSVPSSPSSTPGTPSATTRASGPSSGRCARDYVGGPSALYRADRLAAALERAAGRDAGRLRLYLKREDLNHTGAHKITNALGQALLTRRLGKTRVIAETGAGQHGVATATACALLDLPCVVYMGAEDVRRQAPNVLRMHALGAEVREVTSGSATLKDAINDAMRDWVTNVQTTHYVLGSAVGPHPYPRMVRDLQRVIGDDAAAQLRWVEGRLPDIAVACVGGGSNAIGLLSRFIGEPDVRLIGVEAAGEGVATGHHAAALAGGSPGVLHGSRSYLLQDQDGQVIEAHSISAGLDYPGIGPQLSALYVAGRLEILDATDGEALDALRLVTRSEGIIPALEPSHAVAALGKLLAGIRGHAPVADDAVVLLGLSGRGDKDLGALEAEA